jgi:hypothetical protein
LEPDLAVSACGRSTSVRLTASPGRAMVRKGVTQTSPEST